MQQINVDLQLSVFDRILQELGGLAEELPSENDISTSVASAIVAFKRVCGATERFLDNHHGAIIDYSVNDFAEDILASLKHLRLPKNISRMQNIKKTSISILAQISEAAFQLRAEIDGL